MLGLTGKLAQRAYLSSMRVEGMWALRLRRWLLGLQTKQKYDVVDIFPGVFIEGAEAFRVGNHVSINRGSNLSCVGGVTIGDYVAIGHGTSIITTNHGFADAICPIKHQPVSTAPVTIASNVWIGANVTILAGVSIPSGTIVAAGAVVAKTIEQPDMIVAGVPAKPIKSRFS